MAIYVKNQGSTPVTDGVFKLGLSSATGIALQKALKDKGIEFEADSPNFYWRGVNIPAGMTRSFSLKLQVTNCAHANITISAQAYQVAENGDVVCDNTASLVVRKWEHKHALHVTMYFWLTD